MVKVSVLMGTYNCQNTLVEAIESILNQTFKDWELIICDDGSTDNSYSIGEKYSEKYKEKIVLLSNSKNCGLNITLNNCLNVARGQYIARMDGDDICVPTRLQEEVEFLDKHPEYAIVSTQMIFFDEEGEFRQSHQQGEPLLSDFAKRTPFCHAPCMVRREAYFAVNGYSTAQNRMRVEDWDLWIRMYEMGFRGYNIPKPLYMMRDDKSAFKRRSYRNRINEFWVSVSAVKKLHLSPKYYVYSIRPLIIGLLPRRMYMFLHRTKN